MTAMCIATSISAFLVLSAGVLSAHSTSSDASAKASALSEFPVPVELTPPSAPFASSEETMLSESAPGGMATATVGQLAQAPLPASPARDDPSTIRPGPWRGTGWLSAGLTVGGSLAGSRPATTNLVAVGGSGELGFRVSNWLGIGSSVSRQIHDEEISRFTYADGSRPETHHRGYLTAFDFLLFRFFLPSEGRIQPWLDVGAGIVFRQPPRAELSEVGFTGRGSLGLDLWVSRQVTLSPQITYRANVFDGSQGHSLRAELAIAAHW